MAKTKKNAHLLGLRLLVFGWPWHGLMRASGPCDKIEQEIARCIIRICLSITPEIQLTDDLYHQEVLD